MLRPIHDDVSGYGVYVIQLKSCNDKEALGALYVGSSLYDPSERMRQHDEGRETGAVGLRGQCRRLRPELYLDLPWCWDRTDAFASEHRRAVRLANAGFLVRCDGRVHRPAAQRVPFSERELETVAEQFEHIVRGLLRSARRQLSINDSSMRCAGPRAIPRSVSWSPCRTNTSAASATPTREPYTEPRSRSCAGDQYQRSDFALRPDSTRPRRQESAGSGVYAHLVAQSRPDGVGHVSLAAPAALRRHWDGRI